MGLLDNVQYEWVATKDYLATEKREAINKGDTVKCDLPKIRVSAKTFEEDGEDGIKMVSETIQIKSKLWDSEVTFMDKNTGSPKTVKNTNFYATVDSDDTLNEKGYPQAYHFQVSEAMGKSLVKVQAEKGNTITLEGKRKEIEYDLKGETKKKWITVCEMHNVDEDISTIKKQTTLTDVFTPTDEEKTFIETWNFNIDNGTITPELNTFEKFKTTAENHGVKVDRIKQLWDNK